MASDHVNGKPSMRHLGILNQSSGNYMSFAGVGYAFFMKTSWTELNQVNPRAVVT